MSHLFLAMAVFFGSHLVPALPGVRERIISRIGRRTYLLTYGLISLAALAYVIIAALRAPVDLLWMPAAWQAWITIVLSPLALFFLFAGLLSSNPLSLSLPWTRDGNPGAIVAITRHPVFLGFALWSASHIPPNGDTRSVVLFGLLTLFAISGFWLSDRRARRRLGHEWHPVAERTSRLPFAAIVAGKNRLGMDLPMVAALLLSAGVTFLLLGGGHSALFGVDPLLAAAY